MAFEILSLEAFEWVSYPHFRLKCEEGLIVVRGLNKDARSSADAANRTGKSLIPAVLPRICYDAVPQPVKAPKKAKHAMRKGTRLICDIRRDKNIYRLEKYFDRTARVKIIEDKRNRGIRLKATGDEALKEIFPLNEEQFYSYVYIDTRRPSFLQYGSSADRFRFFEQVFNFEIYRELYEDIKPEFQTLSRADAERSILEDQLLSLGTATSTAALEDTLQKKTEERDALRKKVDQQRSYLRRLSVYCDALTQIPEGKEENIDDLHAQMDVLSQRIDQGVAAEEQARLYAETEKTRQSLKKELEKFKDVVIDSGLADKVEALKTAYQTALADKEEHEDRCQQLKVADVTLKSIPIDEALKSLTAERLEKERDKVRSRIDFLTRLQTVLSGSLAHEKTCPVCASEFSDEGHAAFEARLDKNLKAAKQKAERIRHGLRWHQQNSVVEDLRRLCAREPQFDCDALSDKLKHHEVLLGKMRQKARLIRQFKNLPALEKPKAIENLTDLRARNRALLARLTQAQKTEQARKIMASLKLDLTLENAQSHKGKLEKTLPLQEAKLSDLENTVSELTTDIREARSQRKKIAEVKAQLEAVKGTLEDLPVLEGLRAAFGSKGLVKQRTQKVAQSFSSALNDLAPFLYDEPVSFRLQVTDSQFSIFATRNGLEDDVRTLSGQESRAFSLIVMLSLLRFIPDRLRCDTIFLDEVEANLDASSRRLFVEKFIPELQRFVKTIVIMTPLSRGEFYIPDCTEYCAVKHSGKSTLVRFEDLHHV